MNDFKAEELLVVVGYHIGGPGQDLRMLHGKVSADMAVEKLPDPPITIEEMQPVARAAKMALAKVLRKRKARKK